MPHWLYRCNNTESDNRAEGNQRYIHLWWKCVGDGPTASILTFIASFPVHLCAFPFLFLEWPKQNTEAFRRHFQTLTLSEELICNWSSVDWLTNYFKTVTHAPFRLDWHAGTEAARIELHLNRYYNINLSPLNSPLSPLALDLCSLLSILLCCLIGLWINDRWGVRWPSSYRPIRELAGWDYRAASSKD